MKHNTHIYIAAKAIEFLRESVPNLRTMSGRAASARSKRTYAAKAKHLQRLLRFHQPDIIEASWAPDDILCDKRRFHTFKLFTDETLPEGADAYTTQTFHRKDPATGQPRTYRLGRGAGGLPYKVDHLAAIISDLRRLRDYNDHFTMRQLKYLYLLISHYVVDAHVPMHCDLRDDPPRTPLANDAQSRGAPTRPPKPGPHDRYFSPNLHSQVERIWDRAVTPVALSEGIIVADTYKEHHQPTELAEAVTFDVISQQHSPAILTIMTQS